MAQQSPTGASGSRSTQGNTAPLADPSGGGESHYVHVARGQRIAVELCVKEELMEGQRHLERLVAAYLPDALVSSVGPPGELAACAGAIAVLDLQVSVC